MSESVSECSFAVTAYAKGLHAKRTAVVLSAPQVNLRILSGVAYILHAIINCFHIDVLTLTPEDLKPKF
jgi:hypothetical protein